MQDTLYAAAEGQDFAPVPSKLAIYVQHADTRGIWQPIPLTMLGVLQAQGPFVHEAVVPGAFAAKELRLRILDWPLFYMVNLPDLANQNPLGPMLKSTGSFQNAVVIGDMHIVNTTLSAQVLATHMAHHFTLGFDLYLLYVRGSDLSKAVMNNPVTASYITEGRLQITSLDALQVPWYDDGSSYEEMLSHVKDRASSAYDSTKLIAYNHAALALWGSIST